MNREEILSLLPEAESMTLPKLRAFVREHDLGLSFTVGTKKIEAYERIVAFLREEAPEPDVTAEEEPKSEASANKAQKGEPQKVSGIPPFLQRRMHLIKAAQAQTNSGDSFQPIDTRLRLRQEAGGEK